MTTRTLPLGNDHIIRHTLTAWDENEGENTVLAAQGVECIGMFSASENMIPDPLNATILIDVPIDSDLQVNLIERANGDVWGEILGDKINEHLYAYKGKTVYEIVYSPTSKYRRVTPYLVVESVLAGGAEE